MSNEIRTNYPTGFTIYGCIFRPSDKKVWYPGVETWETWGTGGRTAANYAAVTLTEAATGAGYYTGNFPAEITTAATYNVQLRVQAGVNPANSDVIIGGEEIEWSGTAVVEAEVVSETYTSLCNYALSKIGGGGENLGSFRISSLYDGSDTAALCLVLVSQIRKEALCRAWWAEATKYADLGAELSSAEKADWEYAFNMPSDYLGRCEQISETYHRSTKPQYIIKYDHEIVQGKLFTNNYTNEDDDSAYIRYIWNLTDVSKFSTFLYEAIATKLGAELSAILLADGGKRRQQLLAEYEGLVLPMAEGENAMQTGDDEDFGEYTAITYRTDY